jgi:hypothetical protein
MHAVGSFFAEIFSMHFNVRIPDCGWNTEVYGRDSCRPRTIADALGK